VTAAAMTAAMTAAVTAAVTVAATVAVTGVAKARARGQWLPTHPLPPQAAVVAEANRRRMWEEAAHATAAHATAAARAAAARRAAARVATSRGLPSPRRAACVYV